MPVPVLVVQHTEVCPPARVGRWLSGAGLELDVRRCHAGDPLPPDLSGYAGLVVLGGEMGAHDDDAHPWLTATKALLSEAVRRDLPTLAVCLGAQLLAVAEDGTVARWADGPQAGLVAVRLTPAAAADPLFAGLAGALAPHWNNDVVTVAPAGAVPLSTTDAGLQAFRLGARVWGVQFHPEVDVEILRGWARVDVDSGLLEPAVVESRLAEVAAADDQLVTTWGGFTRAFAALVTA